MSKFFQKFDKSIAFVEDAISTTALAVIVVVVVAHVFFRYVLRSGILWSDELVTVLMVVMAMFGSARAVRVKMHTDLQGLVDSLPKAPRTVIRIFVVLVTLIFLVVFLVASFDYAITAGKLTTILLKIPLKLCYGTMPVGAALMLYEFIKLIRHRIFDKPVPYGAFDETEQERG